MPVLFDLHSRRWQAEGKSGVFSDPRKRKFYRELSALLLDRGWLRFSWLEWNGRVLACQYGFTYNGVYFQLQEGYEPASEHWNVGAGLRAWSIREFLTQGIREYDFMGGVGRHKTDWGAAVIQSKRLLLARKSHKNLLFLRCPEWDAKGREVLRAVLPEKLVARLQARNDLPETSRQGVDPARNREMLRAIGRTGLDPVFARPVPAFDRTQHADSALAEASTGLRPDLLLSPGQQRQRSVLRRHLDGRLRTSTCAIWRATIEWSAWRS